MKRLYFPLYQLFLLFFVVTIFVRPITSLNEDLGRHILLGNIILATHQVPKINLISYTYPNSSFINTTWLYEVFCAVLVKYVGFAGLLLVSSGIALASCIFLYKFAGRRYSRAAVGISSTIFALLLVLRTDVRPEIFSMFFVSIFTITLYRYLEKQTWRIWLLLPLMAIWVNMHIYFFVGPLLVLLFLISNFGQKNRGIRNVLGMVFIGTVLVTTLNPNGIYGAAFPLVVLWNYGFPVVENQTPFALFMLYKNPSILLPLIVFISMICLIFLQKKKRLLNLILVLCFGLLAIFNFRNVLLFLFACFIPAVSLLDDLVKRYKNRMLRMPSFVLPSMYFLGFFVLTIGLTQTIEVKSFGFGKVEYWKGSVDFLLKNNIQGPVFNDFNIGGYLTYRIYPKKVFIDNRPEAYPKEFFSNIYLPMQTNPSIFEKLNEKYRFNVLILSHYDGTSYPNPLLKYLLSDNKYTLLYLDSYSLVLLRNSQKSLNQIKKNQIKKDLIGVNLAGERQKLLRYMLFFEKIGWIEQENEVLRKIKSM